MTRADLPHVLLALLLGLVAVAGSTFSGCGPEGPQHGGGEVGRWVVTPRGVAVLVPAWLDAEHPEQIAAALTEVDTVSPERRDAIQREVPAGTLGPPPGWRVVIRDPGPWASGSSPTGLVTGLTWFGSSTIEVAWATTSAGPRLPALAHEEAHAWVYVRTGDLARAAAAGH